MGTFDYKNKEASWNASFEAKNIFDYLHEFNVLENFDLDNEQHIEALNLDFNQYVGTNCSKGDFLSAAKFFQKTSSIPRFSFFRKPVFNIYPYSTVRIDQLYDVIKEPKYYQFVTEEYRALEKKGDAKDFKSRHFDYVTFSGSFSKRHSSNLVEHSGLMVIDFDKLPDVEKVRSILIRDEQLATEMLFASPGGKGLKWVIKSFPEKFEHGLFFQGVSSYLRRRYHIEPDQSGKDICRACFVCHDPDVYMNPRYL